MAIRKICSNLDCEELNPQLLANFQKDKAKCDALSCRCKQCKAQEYQNNKKEIRTKQKKYNQEHRENKIRDKRNYEKNKKRILTRNKQYQ